MDNTRFLWGDNWWLEDNVAWFVDGEHDLVLQLDMKTKACTFIAKIPDCREDVFRLNSRCIKIKRELYCLPDRGNYIWVYHLEKRTFEQIKIENVNNIRLCIVHLGLYDNKLVVVSRGLGEILEIDTQNKKVDNYYKIADELKECTKVNDIIFCTSTMPNCIYTFDLSTKKRGKYLLPHGISGLHTICFDGENFWLSGNRKEVYLWNQGKNMLKCFDSFPKNFGIYCYEMDRNKILDCDLRQYNVPTFIDAVVVGNCVWFIPFKTNKIVYIDTITYEVNTFEIMEEDEDERSLDENSLKHKYLLQYVANNRYIGLFSLKNNCVFEIDTIEKKIILRNYYIDEENLDKMAAALCRNGECFKEGRGMDSLFLKKVINGKYYPDHSDKSFSIGKMIYCKTTID